MPQAVSLLLALLCTPFRQDAARDIIVVQPDGATQTGEKWALVIGINGYDERVGPLKVAVADAKRMRECLIDHAGFPDDHVILLTDEGLRTSAGPDPGTRPLYTTLQGRIADFCKDHDQSDILLIFFAGHGFHVEATRKDYLAPLDVQRSALETTAVGVDQVLDRLKGSGARQAVLIADACRNVVTEGGRDIEVDGVTESSVEAAEARGVWYLSSCAPRQISREDEQLGGGIYTTYLIEALQGRADGVGGGVQDGLITVPEAHAYVQMKVETYTRNDPPAQTPTRSEYDRTSGTMVLAGTPRALAMGSLSLTTTPEAAEIFIDGNRVGTTPLRIDLSVGTHQLVARAPGYAEVARPVIVGEGVTPHQLELPRETGALSISSTPVGATIWVDGLDRGTTPARVESLLPGEHSVRLALDGHFDYEATAEIEANTSKQLTAMLQPVGRPTAVAQDEGGFLEVRSAPEGIGVYLDGRQVGVTPLVLKDVQPGTHQVQLRSETHEDYEAEVEIERLRVAKVDCSLDVAEGTIVVVTDIGDRVVKIDGDIIRGARLTEEPGWLFEQRVPVGLHKVEITHPALSREVHVPKGQTIRMQFPADEYLGSITLLSPDMQTLSVYLDGWERRRSTPTTLEGVAVGRHTVWAASIKENPQIWEAEVDVVAGQTVVAEWRRSRLPTGRLYWPIQGPVYPRSVAFTEDGSHLLVSAGDGIEVYGVADNSHVGRVETSERVDLFDVLRGNLLPLRGDESGSIDIWDVTALRVVRSIEAHERYYRDLAVSVDGSRIATLGDGKLRVWATATGRCVTEAAAYKKYGSCVALSSDGRYAAWDDNGRSVKLWDVKEERLLKSFEAGKGSVADLRFLGNTEILVWRPTKGSWGQSKVVRVDDLRIDEHKLDRLQVSLDGSTAAHLCYNGCCWRSLPEFEQIGRTKATDIESFAIAARGEALAVTQREDDGEYRIGLVSTADGERGATIAYGLEHMPGHMAFNPEGTMLAVALVNVPREEAAVRVYDVTEQMAKLAAPPPEK